MNRLAKTVSESNNHINTTLLAGGYVVLGGIITLLGWALDIPRLIDWDASGISMKPNAALAAVAAGSALVLFSLHASSKLLMRLLSCIPLLLGGLTLFEHLTGANLRIDTLLFDESPGMRGTAAPGRMGLPMSFSALLGGLALLVGTAPASRFNRRVVAAIGVTLAGLAMLSLTGYLFQADPLFAITKLTAISFQAATVVLAIGIGLITLVPEAGLMRLLRDDSGAGAMMRRALPLFILVPLVLGWFRLKGQEAGLYDAAFGTALRTILEVFFLVGVLWWAALALQKNEGKLRRSERELADFFENATVGLHWVGPDGTILRANQAEFDMLGYAREEYIGRHIAEFHVDTSVIQDIITRLAQGQTIHQQPARLRRKDGAVRDVLINSNAYFEDGEFIHSRCFTHDVTVQKRAEEAQMLLASIVEASDDAIISKSLDGIILSWNAGAEKLYGYTASEAVGQPIEFIVPPIMRGEERSILEQLRKGQRIAHFETVRLAKGGRRVHVSLTVSPLKSGTGEVIGASHVARDITERKLAESRIAAEQERVQILADAVPALISYVDAGGHYRLNNQAYEKWFGQSRLEVHGRHMRDVLGEPAWQAIRPHVEAALAGQVVNFETELEYRDGERRWIDATYTPDFGIDGVVRGFVAHVNDITQRKQAEEDLRVNRELTEMIVRHLDVGAALIRGSDLTFQVVNDGYQAISPDREILGKTVDEAWPEVQPEFAKRCRRVLETGEPIEAMDEPHKIRRSPHGPLELRYFTWSMHRVRLPGDGGWGLLLSAYETTKRKKMEMEVREGEERYRTLFNSMDEGFCVIEMVFDGDGKPSDYRFLEVNPAFEKHTGLRNAVGKRIRELAPDHESHWFGIYGNVALTGQPARFVNEARMLNGRWFDVYAFRVGGPDSKNVAVLFTDISDHHIAEEALKESDRRKDEFLAILAHELRNPLAPIRNILDILKRERSGKGDETSQALDTMDRQLTHMVRLIDDLLDVSRISQGKIDLRKDTVELASVVQQAVEATRPAMECAGHHFTLSLPHEPVFLDADPVRLAQVFGNLLSNACKYTPPEGHIQLGAERRDGEVVVSIKDDGLGIPAGMLSEIFEMFTQVDKSLERSHGGLGIGLTLAQRLVDLHNGSIQARSDGEGRGSEFIVRLPVLTEAAPKPTIAPQKPMRNDLAPRRILVVDDNQDSARSMAMVMKLDGHEAHTAFDGLEALSLAQTFHPDAVLLDIGLPKLSGYDVCRQIRETAWGKQMVIIALTGWGQEADRVKSKVAGFDAHLIKPVDHDELLDLLSRFLTAQPT